MTFGRFVSKYSKQHNLPNTRDLRSKLVDRWIDVWDYCDKHNIPLQRLDYNPESDQFYIKLKL